VKVGANYINSRMAQMEALENGYDSAIFMNYQGKISEGPGSCLFIVRNDMLITPLITASILESITRDTIIELAKNVLKIEVIERDVDRTELYVCDEIFLCGSAMEVAPVINVDGYMVKNGGVGDVTMKIHDEYFKAVAGQSLEYQKWLTPIYDEYMVN
jgi:branched-chain amino acid aminotransferase